MTTEAPVQEPPKQEPPKEAPKPDAPKPDAPKPETPEVPKAPEPKPDEKPQPAQPVVPEKYDLKLPEGSKLDASHTEKIAAFAKERGFTQEQAQALLERDHANSLAQQKLQEEQKAAAWDRWQQESKADKEIFGGSEETFGKNVDLAKRGLKLIDSDGSIKKFLDDTGLGNHKAVIKTFMSLAKMSADDKMVLPGSQSTPQKTDAEILYGKSNEQKE